MIISTETAIAKLLESNGLAPSTVLRASSLNFRGLIAYETLHTLLTTHNMESASKVLACSSQTIRRTIRDKINHTPSSRGGLLRFNLLTSIGFRECPRCIKIKSIEDFSINATKCRRCASLMFHSYYENNKGLVLANVAKRRAALLQATPAWANLDVIKQVYNDAEGMHVDHIVPLQGELVCGLHVENNLQYLTPEENYSKGNKWEVS